MPKIKIMLDSGSDVSPEFVKKFDFDVVPLTISIGDKHIKDYYELDHKKFYKSLRKANPVPTTSQPNPYEFEEYFRKYSDYDDIICITMSKNGSGTYYSAEMAKKNVERDETFKSRIHIFDSLSASLGLTIIAVAASTLAQLGKDVEQIITRLGEIRDKMGAFFLTESLDYLRRGGRVNTVTAIVGGLLNIKAIITVYEGFGKNFDSVRGMKKGMERLIEIFASRAKSTDEIYVTHCDCQDRANEFVSELKARFKGIKVYLFDMGATLSTHAGPGAIGIFFEQKNVHSMA